MTTETKDAISTLKPFVKYLQNLSFARKIGFSFFLKTCSQEPSRLKTLLSESNSVYMSFLSGAIHLPFALSQMFIFSICLTFILSIAFSENYVYSFFLAFLIAFSSILFFTLKMSSLSKTGLILQFRIPENFENIQRLVDLNYHDMATSRSRNIRKAAFSFDSVKSGDLNSYKIISVLDGLIEHLDLKERDFNSDSSEDIIEQMLNKKISGEKNG